MGAHYIYLYKLNRLYTFWHDYCLIIAMKWIKCLTSTIKFDISYVWIYNRLLLKALFMLTSKIIERKLENHLKPIRGRN